MKHLLYMLIVVIAFGLTATVAFASGEEEAPASDNPYALKIEATKAIGIIGVASVFGMAFAAAGAAIGQSLAARAALTGTARQPEASGKLQIQMILAIVFIETLAIYTLVVALILLFVNPLTALL
ncbi:MAG: ATP synthase F0 subunit C [bacterium]|nr:ATP synthase F0 subunit C [bacterium]